MKINCIASNPDDELCTISAYDLISKLINFLNWQTNLNASTILNYMKSLSPNLAPSATFIYQVNKILQDIGRA